jgi:nicotinamidase/pyrazinamidase
MSSDRLHSVLLPPREQVASFDVDAQCTFTPLCPTELPVPEGDQIVDELNAQARFAAVRVGSKDAHSMKAKWLASAAHPPLSVIPNLPVGASLDIHWPAHAIVGTEGFTLLPGLPQPEQYDYFVWKGVEPHLHPYGACYHDLQDRMSTGVIEYLTLRGIRTVLVGGLALDYCVSTTALQLAKAGFAVWINSAATRGIAAHTCDLASARLKQAGVRFFDNAAVLVARSDTPKTAAFAG